MLNSTRIEVMPETCDNCKTQTREYTILGVTQFQDTDKDTEIIRFGDVILCINCWSYVKKNVSICQVLVPIEEHNILS